MIDRRRVLTLSFGALVAPHAALAQQQSGTVPRVGFLISETLADQTSRIAALRAGLRDRGYAEGKNIVILYRSAEGDYERLPVLAAELAALKVDVIVAFGIKALAAASGATTTIPIVIPATSSDPVAMGLVSSLARPSGNVTGSTSFGPEIMAKRLELLNDVVPGMTRVAVLINPANPSFGPTFKQMEVAAKALKLALDPFKVKARGEFDSVFAAIAKRRVDAMVIQDDTLFGETNAGAIAELAARQRLLAVGSIGFAEAGGTIGYGRTLAELYRRGAFFVDRILKGAKPGDLPMEQATRFELVINAKTAKALGIRIPPSVLLRADRVIE
ncbi:MAG: ABC transporter substrate-binding protein [Vicinamibacterales bacterium]